MRDVLRELIVTNADRSEVRFWDPSFQSALQRMVNRFALSPAQARVLALLVLAREDTEIAGILFVSCETVRSHTKAILRASGLRSRKAVILVFLTELGLNLKGLTESGSISATGGLPGGCDPDHVRHAPDFLAMAGRVALPGGVPVVGDQYPSRNDV